MSRHRLAGPAGITVAIVVFAGVFALTRSLLWPPLLAVAAALGTYLMLDDRSRQRVARDDYVDEARRKEREALDRIRHIRELVPAVAEPAARAALESAATHVVELFARVRENAPDSLYSTASRLNGHLSSLEGAVAQYLDIQAKPLLYRDPDALRRGGEEAFARFAGFALESVRLVNQGDVAQYRANLETVAPPTLEEIS